MYMLDRQKRSRKCCRWAVQTRQQTILTVERKAINSVLVRNMDGAEVSFVLFVNLCRVDAGFSQYRLWLEVYSDCSSASADS